MAVNITEPDAYQIFQRDGSDLGDIHIAGTYSVGVESGTPQARFNGGAWTTLTDPVAGGGNFSGILPDQPTGQGTLEVRMSGTPGTVDTKIQVGIGDVFVVAGQSNASGRALAAQVYDPGASPIRAGNYRNDNIWLQLADPFDKDYVGMDLVAAESTSIPNNVTLGSWVPRMTTHYIETVDGVPIGWIPVPKGGSSISQWNRVISSSYLYGSMWKRITFGAYSKVKAVLWFQGESDSGTDIDVYAAKLSQFATDVFNDFGVPTIAALLGPHPDVSGNARIGPRGGTLKAIEENEHLLMGPAFYDVDYDADLHYRTNTTITMVGDRFWAAVKEHFYGGVDGIGPGPFVANYDAFENIINLDFDKDIGYFTADNDTFHVEDSTGATVDVVGPCRSGDRTMRLPLADVPLGDPANMTITYALDNRSAVGATVYGEAGSPAIPALEFAVTGMPGG